MQKLIELLRGKKTYLIAICGLIYGVYNQNAEIIITSLGLIGIRDGMVTEIAKTITKKK